MVFETCYSNFVISGWAAPLTEYLSKIVFVKVRTFDIQEAQPLQNPVPIAQPLQTEVPTAQPLPQENLRSEKQLQEFLALVYLKLMESLALRLKERNLSEEAVSQKGKMEEYQIYVSKIVGKLEESARSKMNKSVKSEESQWIKMNSRDFNNYNGPISHL